MMVQTVVLGNRTVLGAQLDLVPVVVVCVCLREGPERGGLYALLCSLFWCLSGADQGSVCIAVLTLLPVLGSLLCTAMLSDRFFPCLCITFVTLLVEQSVMFFLRYVFESVQGVLFWKTMLPCVLVSTLVQPLVYFLVKRIATIGDAYEST